jgi:hypothetical protein
LDEEVLLLREAKEQEWVDARDQVFKNAIKEFTKQARKRKKLLNHQRQKRLCCNGPKKAIVHYKKQKGNPLVPSLISKLREHYEETKGPRPEPPTMRC